RQGNMLAFLQVLRMVAIPSPHEQNRLDFGDGGTNKCACRPTCDLASLIEAETPQVLQHNKYLKTIDQGQRLREAQKLGFRQLILERRNRQLQHLDTMATLEGRF